MPRIRTVKPDFFRHEQLQDLEAANPGQYPMLVFAGLWGHCDKAGRFEWKPRQLKLDILPFLNYEMAKTLTLLEAHQFVRRYTVDGKEYGCIPTFSEHQRINGKESQEPEKYPQPHDNEAEMELSHSAEMTREAHGKQPGSTGEATGKQSRRQEGKGREGNGDVGHPPSPPPEKGRLLRLQALEVLTFLNEKSGRDFEPLANVDLIIGRLKEGATAEICKAVVEKKCEQWGSDEKMSQYLRPKTLFNKTNFATYRGELNVRAKVIQPDL